MEYNQKSYKNQDILISILENKNLFLKEKGLYARHNIKINKIKSGL